MYFETKDLNVGYNGHILIHDINIAIEKGKILTLIGPNGAGKSTILKTITRHLERIAGTVYIDKKSVHSFHPKEMAKQVAVVLTDRIKPELMTCQEVVAMGRYPYTNALGKLTSHDQAVVNEALERVHGLELAERDFTTLSDGQKQRIMLARAICQEPQVIVLDEPTAYLDIRYKIELLDILREMAHEKQITVIMSLHEIDLASKISDYLICVKGDRIARFGRPEEIFESNTINELYEIQNGTYNSLFGSVELGKITGTPRVFVVGGAGCGIAYYRMLQKRQIPFAAGILYENDLDMPVAAELSGHVVTAVAFELMGVEQYEQAAQLMSQCALVIDAGTPVGPMNALNGELLALARQKAIPICRKWEDLEAMLP